jgi:hypothetical protein
MEDRQAGKLITHVDLDGNPILGDLSGGSGGIAVTEVDTAGNYVDLSGGSGGGSVTSVNNQTGDVVLSGEDLQNNVTSVNGQTGAVTISTSEPTKDDRFGVVGGTLATQLAPIQFELINSQFTNWMLGIGGLHIAPKTAGEQYTVNLQIKFNNQSNGAIIRTGTSVDGGLVVVGGEEKFIDSGTNLVTFTYLINDTIDNGRYQFYLQDNGGGTINITSGVVFLTKLRTEVYNGV